MRSGEIARVAAAMGGAVRETAVLAGGFSHETALVTLDGGPVVVRAGGTDPRVEAAVMDAARPYVPVPRVLRVLAAESERDRPVMVLEYVRGTVLEEVLASGAYGDGALAALGAEVGRVAAAIGTVRFDRPGFFAHGTPGELVVRPERPWSAQLGEMAAGCMEGVPDGRLDVRTRRAWARLCAACAPELTAVNGHARLVHADVNPKNILVTYGPGGWRVDAVLDWEFAYSGCPYGDAANMLRFGAGYPPPFTAAFRTSFAAHPPPGLPLDGDWSRIGRVLDMFALSDLVTRPAGHPVAEQAAGVIRDRVAAGAP